MNDPLRKRQLSVLDANSRTLGGYSEGTLKRIQDLESRDHGKLTPNEYWGDDLFSQEVTLKDFNDLDELQKFWVDKLEVQDAVNNSLLLNLESKESIISKVLTLLPIEEVYDCKPHFHEVVFQYQSASVDFSYSVINLGEITIISSFKPCPLTIDIILLK